MRPFRVRDFNRIKRIVASLLAVIVLVPLFPAYAQNDVSRTSTTSSKTKPVLVVNVNTAPQVTTYMLPDGRSFTDPTLFADELSKIVKSSTVTPDIAFNITSYQRAVRLNSSAMSSSAVSATAAGWSFRFRIGGYQIRFSLEKHMIYGCINRNAWHVGMMITKLGANPPLIDLHLAAWRDRGGPQLGAYNSGSIGRFCTKTRLDYTRVRRAIYLSSATAIGATLGNIIANISTSAVYAILLAL